MKTFRSDADAWAQLDGNFSDVGGLIKPKPGYQPTADDYAAIAYLCHNWDYAWDSLT